MTMNRRNFLALAAGAGALSLSPRPMAAQEARPTLADFDRAAAEPVLQVGSLTSPVKIASMELLCNGRVFLVRVRSTDGAEGLAVPNAARLIDTYPIFLNHVGPYLIGKDARQWEAHLAGLYRHHSNYKLQGLALWVCVAAAEFAVLDLLGKLSGRSIGELLGGVKRRDIAVYRASGNRGNTPQAEVEYLQQLVAETGARAIKFRLGGRISNNEDSLPGRTEALIPLVRKTFGDSFTLYADANSSYDVPHAIRIGRLMEEHKYAFYEEPCPFGHLDDTRQVADALAIPIAGGEQEFSHWRFRYAIHHRVVDIVQPDLHYYGGFVRAMRVARMAALAGMPCTLHMSGSGLGYLDVLHFASCCPDPGEHQEFKGESNIPLYCETSSLQCVRGMVRVPSGPGFGITIDPSFVARAKPVTTI
jgi:L-alanine-DL-glutamate epimerase-like enolase superfamily enzyme